MGAPSFQLEVAKARSHTRRVFNATERELLESVSDVLNTTKVATGTLTSAQILALNATPITVVAAPAAGQVIIVDEIQLFLDYGSATYVAGAGEDLTLQYVTSNTDIAVIDNDAVALLTAAADAHWIGRPQALYNVGAAAAGDGVLLSDFDAEGLEFTIATGEVATGDSTLKYRISYHEVTYLT